MLAIGPLGIGPFEAAIILAIVVILFGATRLGEVGAGLGRGIREFRKATKEEEPPRQIPEAKASAGEAGAPVASTVESGPFCTSCGAKNDEGAKFCSECGTALQARVN